MQYATCNDKQRYKHTFTYMRIHVSIDIIPCKSRESLFLKSFYSTTLIIRIVAVTQKLSVYVTRLGWNLFLIF